MSFYEDCIAAGIPTDNHESDLYVKDAPETRELLAKHKLSGVQARPFRSNTDGGMWWDCPFLFDPWWVAREKAKP